MQKVLQKFGYYSRAMRSAESKEGARFEVYYISLAMSTREYYEQIK